MQDIDNTRNDLRNRQDATRPLKPEARDGAYASLVHSRDETPRPPQDDTRGDPSPLSDALHIPTLIGGSGSASQKGDVAAPLSDALHVPTLMGDDGQKRDSDEATRRADKIIAAADAKGGKGASAQPAGFEQRASTPAAPPRGDAASLIGVPSNHQQTPVSGRLAQLDRVALVLGAIIVIGPLFAAMVSRSMG